jgi:hypothetical protein
MALEWRGNNLYYYEKERDGDRVRSVYSGKGEIAYLIHSLNLSRKREKEYEKQARDKLRQKEVVIDAELDSLFEITKVFTDALFLANGYHQHKRQWRKKRNGKAKG